MLRSDIKGYLLLIGRARFCVTSPWISPYLPPEIWRETFAFLRLYLTNLFNENVLRCEYLPDKREAIVFWTCDFLSLIWSVFRSDGPFRLLYTIRFLFFSSLMIKYENIRYNVSVFTLVGGMKQSSKYNYKCLIYIGCNAMLSSRLRHFFSNE